MKQRGENSISKKIIEIDEEKRKTQTILQTLLAERNSLSKEIGKLKSQKKDSDHLLNEVEKSTTGVAFLCLSVRLTV